MSRDVRIELRLSPEERESWKKEAHREERTLSDFVRVRVNTSLRQNPQGTTQPLLISPREWPVSETVPQENRETLLDRTVVVLDEAMTYDPRTGAGLPLVSSGTDTDDELEDVQCRMAPFHVKGRYCKVCGEVPE